MSKIIPGHLVNFEDVYEMEQYEDYIYYGGAMTVVEDVYEFDLAMEVYCGELEGN